VKPLILALLCLAVPVVAQAPRADLKSDLAPAVTLTSNMRANTAATGKWVDLTGYGSADVVVERGLVEATAQYAVLQDSASGAALATVDSANIAADSTISEIGYTGTKRFIRILLRASGNAGDSSYVSAIVVRGNCHKKPC